MTPKTRAEELAAEPYIPVMDRGPQDTAHTEMMRLLDLTAQQAAELRRLAGVEAENAKLRTVMIAAAEEISAHWEAHCDADGYGPVNLLRRLEEGIPSEYGYTAGAWVELKAERDRLAAEVEALRADAERLDYLQTSGSTVSVVHPFSKPYRFMIGGLYGAVSSDIRAAIDSARKEQG